MEEQEQMEDYTIKPLDGDEGEGGKRFYKNLAFLGLAVLLGLVSGWGLVFYRQGRVAGLLRKGAPGRNEAGAKLEKGKVYGSNEGVFKDTATGVVERNENGKGAKEGTHRLLREGGESQTVYLTSSVLDLDEFVGAKVEIWGETFSSTKVGWLMDVGKIKVLE